MKSWVFNILIIFISLSCSGNRDTSNPAEFELNINDENGIEFLKELTEDHRNNPENYVRLSSYYLEGSNYIKALEILRQANDRFSDHEEIKLLLLKSYLLAGENENASKLFKEINSPANSLLYYQVAGEYWYSAEEYTKSLNNINMAISLDHGNADLFAGKARNLLQLNDTTGAVINYTTAMNKKEVSFQLCQEFLSLLSNIDDQELFQKVYNQLPNEMKNHPETHISLANYLSGIEKYDSAKTHLHLLGNLQQYQREKIKGLSEINFQQRHFDSAIYYLKDFTLISPDLLLIRARAFDRSRNFEESEKTYLEILRLDSAHTIALDELDKLRRKVRYLQLKRREESRIQIVPSNPITPIN